MSTRRRAKGESFLQRVVRVAKKIGLAILDILSTP